MTHGSVRGFVRLWIDPPKCTDLLKIEAKMFLDGPSIALLHVCGWNVLCQGRENAEIFF